MMKLQDVHAHYTLLEKREGSKPTMSRRPGIADYTLLEKRGGSKPGDVYPTDYINYTLLEKRGGSKLVQWA